MVGSATGFNYAEALQKAVYFYECQRSGKLPATNRVAWRGDSGLEDGHDNGVDLTGGWYNAGDHVKFHMPIATSATLLAWGAIAFRTGYDRSEQFPFLLDSLRWICDYFVKCHTGPDELWAQVALGGVDHAWWGPAEVMPGPRPSFKIDASRPGSDLAAEVAAALGAAAIVFRESDPEYAGTLLTHAVSLFDFAERCRGCYSDSVEDAGRFYPREIDVDEMVWGALWLHMATGDDGYLAVAEELYDELPREPGTPHRRYKDAPNWQDKTLCCVVLLAVLTGKEPYRDDAERWLDWMTVGYDGQRAQYTAGGLVWLARWGALRQASNAAFLAFVYSDALGDSEKRRRYHDFAARQIDYILGDNPLRRSFEVGFGNAPPRNPHHRTAHGSWSNSIHTPRQNRHMLYGALIGGPDRDDHAVDDRTNYILNEVSCDYNAGFTGALARMASEYGGKPLRHFPPEERRGPEFTIDCHLEHFDLGEVDMRIVITNCTGWPARASDRLSLRYYLAGAAPDGGRFGVQVHGPKAWVEGPVEGPGGNRYVLVDFAGERVAPGDAGRGSIELRLLITGPKSWNPALDWQVGGEAGAGSPPSSSVLREVLSQANGMASLQEGAGPAPCASGPQNIVLYSDNVVVCGIEPPHRPKEAAVIR